MALIKCPECGKEISDKAGACPHCGCPIGNMTQPIQNNDGKSNKGSKKILIGVVAVVAIAGTGYYFGIAKPQQHLAEQKAVYEEAQDLIDEGKYDKAIEKLNSIIDYDGAQDAINEAETGKEKATYLEAENLLEQGKYDDGIELLNTIPDYPETAETIEQAKYESYAYSAVKAVKEILKNPDSLNVYDVKFYDGFKEDESDNKEETDANEESDSKEDDVSTENKSKDAESEDNEATSKYPTVVMHCGAQNGFGGNTESYASCTYSEEDGEYTLDGFTNELDLDELDEDDDDYLFFAISARLINEYYDNGNEVGSINTERFNTVLKNAAYGSVKIIQ